MERTIYKLIHFLFQYTVMDKGRIGSYLEHNPDHTAMPCLGGQGDIRRERVYTQRYMEVRQQQSMRRCSNNYRDIGFP